MDRQGVSLEIQVRKNGLILSRSYKRLLQRFTV